MLKYTVRVSNGDYSPSYPYKGRDKDIALAIATAYITARRCVTLIEQEVDDEKEGK